MFGISLHPSKKEEMLSPNLLFSKHIEHTDRTIPHLQHCNERDKPAAAKRR